MKLIVVIGMAISSFFSFGQSTVYVNTNATGGNNGSSWSDAYTDLNAAIVAASNGSELWVAEGTYSPPSGFSFTILNELSLYGGFPSTGNPSMSDRDWELYPTALDGDVNNDDALNIYSDNSPRVISFEADFVLDGFLIVNGGNGSSGLFGTGLHASSANGNVTNCLFEDNKVFSSQSGFLEGAGGAIWLESTNSAEYQDTITITNCIFERNAALNGGAICAERGVRVENCRFGKNIGFIGPAISLIAPWDDLKDEVFGNIYNSVFWKNTTQNNQPVIHLTTTRSSSDGSQIDCTVDFCTFKSEQTTIGYISNNPSTNFSNIYISLKNSLVDLTSDANGVFPIDYSMVTDGAFVVEFGPVLSNSTDPITGHLLEYPDYEVEDTLAMNFVLDCSSGGINLADSLTFLTQDINGNDRVNGDRPDVGAFESDCFSTASVIENQDIVLNIYPNPAKHSLNIPEFSDEVRIYSLSGEILIEQQFPNQVLDISSLVSGIYIIKVRKDGISMSARFVKDTNH